MQCDELPFVDLESTLTPSSSHTKTQENEPEMKEFMDIKDRSASPKLVENNCSEYEDVGTLAETVAALRVEDEMDVPVKPQAEELLRMFIQDLSEYDTTFLKEYLDVLQNNNQTAIKNITNNIVVSIEEAVKQQAMSEQEWPENVLVVLLSWLCTSVLCLTDPQVPPPYRVFGELLSRSSKKVLVRLAAGCWRLLGAGQLVELADAAAASGPGAEPSLADLLLRAAEHRLRADGSEPQWALGALRDDELTASLSSTWAAAEGAARSLLARAALRACAAGRLKSTPAVLRAAARSRRETVKVLVDVSKLVLLFEDDEAQAAEGQGRPEPVSDVSH